VYPKAEKFIADQRLRLRDREHDPVIEIYRVNGDKVTTEYLFPVDSAP
jgi:hypothetical protein